MLAGTEEVVRGGGYTLLTSDEKTAALEWPFLKERSKSVFDCQYGLISTDGLDDFTIEESTHFCFVHESIRAAGKESHCR